MDLSKFLASMWTTLIDPITNVGLIVYESAFYIIIGFGLAGLIHEYLPTRYILRNLGGRNFKSVSLAAILGIPVPLCSCSVLPAAMALYRKGASRPAIASFLISVPETGADSIAITYGMMGPFMAVYRPLAGIVAALAAGLLTVLVGDDASEQAARNLTHSADHHAHHHHDHDGHGHGHDHAHGADYFEPPRTDRSSGQRLAAALEYGYRNLFDEIAFWITLGLVLSGLILGLVPRDYFTLVGLDSGILPMLLMALLAVPIYTCASMSTPVAVGLIASGISPGAALVFLLTGPATNVSTMLVLGRVFGARLTAAYIAGLLSVSIAAGLFLDWWAGTAVWQSVAGGLGAEDSTPMAVVKYAACAVFAAMILFSARRGSFTAGYADLTANMAQTGRLVAGAGPLVAHQAMHLLGPDRLKRLNTLPWRRALRRTLQAAAMGAAVVALIYVLPAFMLIVGPGQQGLIQQFGAVTSGDLEPGLHLRLPAPLGRGVAIDRRAVRQIAIRGYAAEDPRASGGEEAEEALALYAPKPSYYLTADENEIDLEAIIQFRIADSYRAAFGVEAAQTIIGDAGRQVLTALCLEMPIDKIYSTGRLAIENAFQARLSETVTRLGIGYEIVAARLLYIHAPGPIHEAFRDVASANEDRTRAIFEAEGQRLVKRSDAAGRAAAITAKAKVDSIGLIARAKGQAGGFSALADVHDAAPRITEQRLRLEAIERNLGKPPKIIDGASSARGETDLWIDQPGGPVVKYRFKE